MNTKSVLVVALALVVGHLAGGYVFNAWAQSGTAFQGDLSDLFLDPDRYIVLTLDAPYSVPPGRVLMVETVMDTNGDTQALFIDVNGQTAVGLKVSSSANSVARLTPGLVAHSGDIVVLRNQSGSSSFATGKLYLEGQDPGF